MGGKVRHGPRLHEASPWIEDFTPGRRPSVTLLCLPYAGGGANTFRSWVRPLPPWIGIRAVQLPGRENRFSDPLVDRVAPVVAELAAPAATLMTQGPVAFFGHSMGAILAWELTRVLRGWGVGEPSHLFVSGRRPPWDPPLSPPVHQLPDQAFLRELERLGGTPPEVLDDAELMELMLPMLRADFTLVETWRPEPAPPLSCPITTFSGREDREAPPADQAGWASETTGPVTHHELPGGHFFPNGSRAALLELICSILRPL